MTETHVVAALKTKRGEIAGQIERKQQELKQLVVDLDHVEASLRLFDPTIEVGTIKPRPVQYQHHAFKGEVSRIVLEAMRTAGRAMTTPELATLVMRERGLDPDDGSLHGVMVKRIGTCLRMHRERGTLRSERGDGPLLLWRVAA